MLQLYHTESIYLVLVGVEVWTSNDLITINASHKEESLDHFASYRQHHINPYHNNDNSHLITYVLLFSGLSTRWLETGPLSTAYGDL